MCRTWSRSCPAGRGTHPRSVSHGIGARVATAHCDHHVRLSARRSWVARWQSCPLGQHDGDGRSHPLPAGSRRRASGVAEAPNVGTGGSACLRECRIGIQASTKKGPRSCKTSRTGTSRRNRRWFKYLDNNPEGKRQVKSKRIRRWTGHLAEELAERSGRRLQAQNQVDSFTDSATPGS
jgi:hypothetical protein